MKSGMLKSSLYAVFALALAIGLTAGRADASQVYGSLSNFDFHVFVDSANDLELTVMGFDSEGDPLECDDISYVYPGWGSANFTCEEIAAGMIKLTWSETRPLTYCSYPHFGVSFEGDEGITVRPISATWTLNGEPQGIIPFLSQMWVGSADCRVGDIIIVPPEVEPGSGPWTVTGRAWALADPANRPELEDLMGGTDFINGLTWNYVQEDSVLYSPGDSVMFWTDPVEQQGAYVVVRYAVWDEGLQDTVAHFWNAVSTTPRVPSLTEYGLIVLVVLVLAAGVWVMRQRRKIGKARA